MSTVANSATARYATSHAAGVHTPAAGAQLKLSAMVHGFSVAYWFAGGLLTLAALTALLLINARPQGAGQHGPDAQPGAGLAEDAVPVLAH